MSRRWFQIITALTSRFADVPWPHTYVAVVDKLFVVAQLDIFGSFCARLLVLQRQVLTRVYRCRPVP